MSRFRILGRGSCAVRVSLLAVVTALVFAPASSLAEDTVEGASKSPPLDYARQIRPILSNACFRCHGPDEKERRGGLRLDLPEAARKAADSGKPAIVPGKPDDSELIARIATADAALKMPPADSKKSLTPQEIEMLQRWVREGADHKQHWAYVKPQRPALPAVKNAGWVRTGIDAFILQRLEKAGLEPAREADRTTLIRRLSLDLTGLPPSIDDVDAFVRDPSPDAYEKLVDRILASPHFGERMAQDWLDLSRYGDTNGYENDSDRSIWMYRDWVINAFNANMPFDWFTVEQIAGDLLPNATREQRIATGFSRNVTYNEEGGADPDEYMVKYAVDRTSTTATVFLGMTMACAECHDHKYDPLSQRDFYSLLAFFNSVDGEKGAQGHDVPLPPLLSFPSDEQTATLTRVRGEMAELDKRIAKEISAFNPSDPLTGPAIAESGELRDYVWIDDALPTGTTPQGNEDARSWVWGEAVTQPVLSGKLSHSRTAKGFSRHEFVGAVPSGLQIGEGDKLFAHVYLDPQNPPKMVMLQFHDGTWEHRVYWGDDLSPSGTPGMSSRLSAGPLPPAGSWQRLEVDAQAVGLAPGAAVQGMSFAQFDGKVTWDKAGLITRTQQAILPSESQLAWETFERSGPNPPSKLPNPVKDAVNVAVEKRTDAHRAELRNYFLRHIYGEARPQLDPLNKQYDDLKAVETKTDKAIPTTMVMTEMAQRRPAFVLMRGNYQTPGEPVSPNVPAILPPLPAGAPVNRLGLARWLVDRDNPLTARVTVNRFWKQFFGTGLVKTMEDFGSQGEFPSHPELLDWLACEFASGASDPSSSTSPPAAAGGVWDVKHLLRTIVLSSAYRQSAAPSPAALRVDPYNRLLSHATRFRLSAEGVRDNALAISGLLNREQGGKSVYPFQPADYYADKGRWKWTLSTGPDLYRRGLYTFWRRTTFYPSFQVFDAPTRETCTVDRPRTNTPLQALITLNDPTFIEAARVFGQRILLEGGGSLDDKLIFAFRMCVSRVPEDKEIVVLRRIYEGQLAKYQSNEAAAKAVVSNGSAPRSDSIPPAELATWTAIGNLLLNLDETITRE